MTLPTDPQRVAVFVCPDEVQDSRVLCSTPETVAFYMPGLIKNTSSVTSRPNFTYATRPSHAAKLCMLATDPTTRVVPIHSTIILPPEAYGTWSKLLIKPSVSIDSFALESSVWYIVVSDNCHRQGVRQSCVLLRTKTPSRGLQAGLFHVITHHHLGMVERLVEGTDTCVVKFDYSVHFLSGVEDVSYPNL